jgi:threonylcarbamoyladenosine tRNA methylthiotransferase MtaB
MSAHRSPSSTGTDSAEDRGPTLVTFGCRLNAYESEVMRGLAREAAADDELVIVNTCAVTAEAERAARKAIRRSRREHPNARIVVTGCSAQIDPARYADMPEVDKVIGNAEKLRASSYRRTETERVVVNDIMSVRETAGHLVCGFEEKSRAFLQVQNGCDHRCTFCVIPYGRGNSRSVPVDRIEKQIRALVADGVAEVVLSGVDVTAYGADLEVPRTLGEMVREVLDRVPELPRLRLSSLDPVEIDPALWRLLADEPRLMPHLHLSVQSGDDTILRRMKRRHLRADSIAVARRARSLRPDIAIGADLIAGFPTETEEMFDNTLRLVEECGLVYLHVFPYSSRPGTPASRMPQLPGPVRRERAARLRTVGDAALSRFLASKVGAEEEVLMESSRLGRTGDFALVEVTGGAEPRTLTRVRIKSVAGDRLVA